jgi:hypothetical protein
LSLEIHPDKHPEPRCAEHTALFQKVRAGTIFTRVIADLTQMSEAYEILKDDSRKRRERCCGTGHVCFPIASLFSAAGGCARKLSTLRGGEEEIPEQGKKRIYIVKNDPSKQSERA